MATEQQIPNQTRRGIFFAVGAFGIWGLNPLYFRLIRQVSAPEIIAHRVIWMVILMLLAVAAMRRFPVLLGFMRNPRTMALLAVTAILIAINWLTFTWAVTHEHVLDTSMGYFINPLANVFLGMIFLGERLRPGQILSVTLAGAGVVYMIIQHGTLPWIAIVLPISFGLYGLLRKQIEVDSINGLLIEAIILSPLAIAYLIYLGATSEIIFLQESWGTRLLITFCGPITIAPLVLFASCVRRIPLSTVGIIQYLAPSTTFLLGVFAFREPFDAVQLTTFACIWCSLIIFTTEGILHNRSESRKQPELSYTTD